MRRRDRSGRVRAGHVIVATQLPFLDRGLFFAKAHPTTSYAIAAAVDAELGSPWDVHQRRPADAIGAVDAGRRWPPARDRRRRGTQARRRARHAPLATNGSRRSSPTASGSTRRVPLVDARLHPLSTSSPTSAVSDGATTASSPRPGFAKWGMTKGTLPRRSC